MNRAAVGADIIAALIACFGSTCEYQFVQARSSIPAECNTISLVWGRKRNEYEDDCGFTSCDRQVTTDLSITITRCCVTSDAGLQFNIAAEENETLCFLRDLEVLENCIECTNWRQLSIDHAIDRISLSDTTPGTTRGGCMDATLSVRIVSTECCP